MSCRFTFSGTVYLGRDTTIDDKSDSPVKTSQIRSFIKNIGLPSSPVLGKKAPPNTSSATTSTSSTAKPAAAPGRRVSSSAEPLPGAGPKNKAKEGKLAELYFRPRHKDKVL